MKKLIVLSLALALSMGVATADTYSVNANTAAVTPGINAPYSMELDQFDSQGGLRVLNSVTVQLTLNSWGGYYSVDNDGDTIANFSMTHGASGRLTSPDVGLPSNVGNEIYALMSSGTLTLQANSGDPTGEYNWDGGADNYRLDGPGSGSPLTASSSGSTGSNLNPYIGSGTFTVTLIASQGQGNSSLGGVAGEYAPAFAQGFVTVIYDYTVVPEPTALALIACGCVALGLRRRPSGQA